MGSIWQLPYAATVAPSKTNELTNRSETWKLSLIVLIHRDRGLIKIKTEDTQWNYVHEQSVRLAQNFYLITFFLP